MSPFSASDLFPLHKAARDGKAVHVESLLKIDPQMVKKKDSDGRYPIHWAVSSKSYETVLLLAQEPDFDPDLQDDSGWTPIMIAANMPDVDRIVNLLICKGADVNLQNDNGQSAMHFIASKANLDLAHNFLNLKPPASVRLRDKRGLFPIHRAAAAGSSPMVSLLIEANSPINATDNDGFTALHHAIAEGFGETAITLLKAGADFSRTNKEGQTALSLAPSSDVREYIERIAEIEGISLG